MIGKILTQTDLDELGLKPTNNFFGNNEKTVSIWEYYESSTVLAILQEMANGSFMVRAYAQREVRI